MASTPTSVPNCGSWRRPSWTAWTPPCDLPPRAPQRSGDSPGKCQQVWCPVCALAALVSGEQHPLLTVIADHSVALLAVISAIIEQSADATQSGGEPPEGPPPPPDSPNGDGPPPPGPGRYQHIPVTVEE